MGLVPCPWFSAMVRWDPQSFPTCSLVALDLVQTGDRSDGPALFEGHHWHHVLHPRPAPLTRLQPGRLPEPWAGVAVGVRLCVLLR